MKKRIENLRQEMVSLGLSTFIVTRFENLQQSNIRYLCGYTGSNGVLIVGLEDAWFITDGRYSSQAKEQVSDSAQVYTYKGGKNASEAFLNEVRDNEGIKIEGKIGIEGGETTAEFYQTLRAAFPDNEIISTSSLVLNMSSIRDEDEIAAIKRAVEITDRAFEEILSLVKPGISEKELAAEITYRHTRYGAEQDSFELIVASGKRSALPHGVASTKEIERGDFVTFDIGCFVDGYASDFTRTVVVGEASEKQVEIYEAVRAAQKAATDAAKPGMKCCDLDKIARDIIDEAGYGQYFIHSLGHGLGHVVHAKPVLSTKAEDILQPGHVVTVEPGIYIPELGGVRIEDDVVITEDGREVLSSVPRKLLVL